MLRASILLAAAASVLAAPDCKNHPLLYPMDCCNFKAPASFNVTFVTGVGNITVHSERAYSPYGVDRFYSLVKCHYYDGATEKGNDGGFFRVVPGFVVQWGIAGVPAISQAWENLVIPDDPMVLSNTAGTLAYAAVQDNSGKAVNRTTQIYLNFADNSSLDPLNFTPFGMTDAAGLAVANKIYAGYGQNPDQDSIYAEGDAYLQRNFPKLTYTTLTVLSE